MNTRYSPQNGRQPSDSASWMGAQDRWQGGQSPYQRPVWQEEPSVPEEEAAYPGYDEAADAGYQEPYPDWPEEPSRRIPLQDEEREVIATNRTVLLTCTLAAMMGVFGLFLCFAEKRSRAIRHFAGQSAALTIVHVTAAMALFLLGGLLGAIPLLGFLLGLVCWLLYLAVLIVTVVVRVRMMLFAYRGWRFTLPVLGETIAQRMGV